MTPSCISEPVSYLRLERYLVDEVSVDERRQVQAHLAQCPVCSECLEALRADGIALPPLPAEGRHAGVTPMTRVPRMAAMAAALAAAAAVMLTVIERTEAPRSSVPAPTATKGGELAIALVREHRGSVAVDAARYVSGDRFEVQVTCPPGDPLRWDVVVLQGGEAFFPLTPRVALHCGNRVTLPGAFSLTGSTPARVCVVTHPTQPPSRAELSRALPEASACVDVLPAQ